MKYLLGIDLGTSATKTVLFGLDGKIAAAQECAYPMLQPQNGWAEQDPQAWWKAVTQGIQSVLQQSGALADEIGSIGLSGQMHGLVLLDDKGAVLRNAILWCDQRTKQECEQMNALVGAQRLLQITANPALTGFTASKILWVQNHEPSVWKRCAHILLPKDYIRYRLTGEFATEVSDASGMQLMDVGKRCWSAELLQTFEISASQLPSMHESTDETGTVHRIAANESGLREGTPVVGGAADNAAAAVGMGVVKEGGAFTTLGTSGVIYALTNHFLFDPLGRIHTLCASVPGKWVSMSCTQSAGLSLHWLRDICCQSEMEQDGDPYARMDALAEGVALGSENLLFLPYLMGERSPHPDPDCRGVFFGLSPRHTRAHLIRAVMEGVAYSQRECLDVFREIGVPINTMALCGGGANSPLWRKMLCDLYACPVQTIHSAEGAASGAAMLAGVGSQCYASLEEACRVWIHPAVLQLPDAQAGKAYESRYRLYRQIYRDLKEDFQALSRLEQ